MTKVEHLGGDRWRVRIFAGKDATGKPRQLSRSFRADGQRSADRKARGIVKALDDELDQERDRKATVNGMVDDWLAVTKRASSTEYRNRSIVAAIRDGLGTMRLEKVTPRDVDLWYGRLLADGKTETTVHHYHRILHAVMLTAERWDRVTVAPTRRVKPPERNRPNPSPPATADLAPVIADASPTLQLAAFLAARLGLRRGEVCGLRWEDLKGARITISRSISDVPGKPLEVKATKTKQARTVTVDEVTMAVLDELRAGRATGWILADPYDPDMPRRPGWLTKAWDRLCRRHGVHIRFHDLRHWSATNMIDAGIPLPTVSARLGHSRTSTTVDVYAKSLPGADEAAAAALAARLPGPNNVRDGIAEAPRVRAIPPD